MIQRTKASVELMKLPDTQEEIARAIHLKDRSAISYWAAAKKIPSEENKIALEKVYGIKREWWDEPVSATVPATFEHKTVRSRAIEVEHAIHDMIAAAKDEPTSKQKAIALERCIKMLTSLGKLTGESLEVSAAQILRTPAWREIMTTIARVLEDEPETMQRIGEALVGLDDEEAA